MTQLLRLTKSPMCANTQQSTDMMELSGLALQVSHFRTMPLNSPKRMEQRRKSMLTNLRQPLKVARATENHARLVSEWTIKSICSFNTTLHPKIQCILPEKVVVVHALPEPRQLSSSVCGTRGLQCLTANSRTRETAMRTLRKFLSSWRDKDIDLSST